MTQTTTKSLTGGPAAWVFTDSGCSQLDNQDQPSHTITLWLHSLSAPILIVIFFSVLLLGLHLSFFSQLVSDFPLCMFIFNCLPTVEFFFITDVHFSRDLALAWRATTRTFCFPYSAQWECELFQTLFGLKYCLVHCCLVNSPASGAQSVFS